VGRGRLRRPLVRYNCTPEFEICEQVRGRRKRPLPTSTPPPPLRQSFLKVNRSVTAENLSFCPLLDNGTL
ncbi:MAG: hypothetical protein ACRDIV_04190, partial [Ktedonobacteraceae bacterium]